jgi:hypothetical protein
MLELDVRVCQLPKHLFYFVILLTLVQGGKIKWWPQQDLRISNHLEGHIDAGQAVEYRAQNLMTADRLSQRCRQDIHLQLSFHDHYTMTAIETLIVLLQ